MWSENTVISNFIRLLWESDWNPVTWLKTLRIVGLLLVRIVSCEIIVGSNIVDLFLEIVVGNSGYNVTNLRIVAETLWIPLEFREKWSTVTLPCTIVINNRTNVTCDFVTFDVSMGPFKDPWLIVDNLEEGLGSWDACVSVAFLWRPWLVEDNLEKGLGSWTVVPKTTSKIGRKMPTCCRRLNYVKFVFLCKIK